MIGTSQATPAAVSRGHYAWFTRLWAAAILLHLAGNAGHMVALSAAGVLEIGMGALAVSLLVRPDRIRLALMAGLHIPVVALKAPVVGNHEMLELFVHLLILAALAVRWSDWRSVFVPAARLTLVVAYGFIALSKLNSDFFDPSVSCAVLFGNELGRYVGVVVAEQEVLSHLVIWGTVAAEVAVPVLLVLRWRYAVPFALGFHFVLALDPIGHVYDFSSTLLPLFLLFLPPDFSSYAGRWLARFDAGLARRMLMLAVLGEVLILMTDTRQWLIAWPAWLALGGGALWLAATYCRRAEWKREPLFTGLHPALGIVVGLVALNGLAPYLELKTASAFNMYSNLRTAQGETNHLLIPATLPLTGGQDHLVEIVETNDPRLDRYRDQGLRIPAPSLLTYLAGRPDSSAIVAVDGRTLAVPSEEARDLLGDAPSWSVATFGHFRAVDTEGAKSCLRLWEAAH